MWVVEGELMSPLLDQPAGVPYHSRQFASLPRIHVQNSSLEMAWTRALTAHDSIAGERVAPFFTDEVEGFSIDYPDDWRRAEEMISAAVATLPAVAVPTSR
jgi:N-acylneuraminate cytidylyltransferase